MNIVWSRDCISVNNISEGFKIQLKGLAWVLQQNDSVHIRLVSAKLFSIDQKFRLAAKPGRHKL